MKGRKPKPALVHKDNGDPSRLGKKQLDAMVAAQPPAGGLNPPPYLNDYALEEWSHYVPILAEMGQDRAGYQGNLALACIHLADARHYHERIEECLDESKGGHRSGDVQSTGSGSMAPNPYVHMHSKSAAAAIKCLCELGLTPSSNTRLASDKPTPAGKFDEWNAKGAARRSQSKEA